MNAKDSNIFFYIFLLEDLDQSDQTSNWFDYTETQGLWKNLTHTEVSTALLCSQVSVEVEENGGC